MRVWSIFLAFLICGLFFFSTDTRAKITRGSDLDIRILYDNSGSMFPGYRLEGGVGKSQSGALFFHEYPEFRGWLKNLISSQGQINGKRISITAFTEHELKEILPPTFREDVDGEKILQAFENLKKTDGKFRWGNYTYLTENLEKFIQGFEGVVWLITDNIIEREGTDSYQDIEKFFTILRDRYEYKSVHLYKYPFEDVGRGQESNLAIYAILLSPHEIDTSVLEYFDEKFDGLAELFTEEEHLKLKDLAVRTSGWEGKIKVDVEGKKGNLIFHERAEVKLKFEGGVRSYLTHHTIDSGARYRMSVEGPFIPDPKAKKEFGVKAIPSSKFMEIEGTLVSPIAPRGYRNLEKIIKSKEPITIPFRRSGIISFIKSARGVKVEYRGKIRFSLYNVKITLERSRLAGIFGIDQACSVFDIQDVRVIRPEPRTVKQRFSLETGSGRGIFLLILLLLLLLPLGFLIWYFLQKKPCRIRVDQKRDTISFSPLGTHPVRCEGRVVGVVKRGLGKDFTFSPIQGFADITVTPGSQTGKYNATVQNRTFAVSIEPLMGGTVNTGGGQGASGGQTGPGPTSGSRSGGSRFRRPGPGGQSEPEPGPRRESGGGPTGGSTPPPSGGGRRFKKPGVK